MFSAFKQLLGGTKIVFFHVPNIQILIQAHKSIEETICWVTPAILNENISRPQCFGINLRKFNQRQARVGFKKNGYSTKDRENESDCSNWLRGNLHNHI